MVCDSAYLALFCSVAVFQNSDIKLAVTGLNGRCPEDRIPEELVILLACTGSK